MAWNFQSTIENIRLWINKPSQTNTEKIYLYAENQYVGKC